MRISIPEARDRPGVTVVDVNLKFIWDLISQIRIGEKGLAYVVDEKGFLIAHPDISLVLKKVDMSSLPQVKHALADQGRAGPIGKCRRRGTRGSGVFYAMRPHGGEPQGAVGQSISTADWKVFVEQPTT
jgi:hypothetical protein